MLGTPDCRRDGFQQLTVSLLDPKRCMNIGIFLKQFKRSAAEMVEDIRRGSGERYCGERLAELLKHLPEKEEVKRLKAFRGERSSLSEAELFLALLLDVPSYTLRLEAMVLRKEFPATVGGLRSSARVLKECSQELIGCSELHMVLRLVLKAGNFMNAGGYAGNAAGFHISSLLKLADTKANKPGMSLLHFVAMEVQQRYPELLCFPGKLEHISRGSRLSEGGLVEEFCRLQKQVSSLARTLEAAEHREIRTQMAGFLQGAENQLEEVQREMEAMRASRQQLLEFLCEDEETFKLEECCQIFSTFCDKFLKAVQENKERELEEQRRQRLECERLEKRRSTATCSVTEDHSGRDDLEVTLERNLRAVCRYGSIRRTKSRSPTINPARMAYFSCQGPWVRRDREKDIELLSDEENARQLREVSETVLSQQMQYVTSPDNNGRPRSAIAKWPPVQPAHSENSTEVQLGNAQTQPDFSIQPSTAPDLSRTSGSNLPSTGKGQVPAEISDQLLTKNISGRPDNSSPQSDRSIPTKLDFNTHPPTRSRPPKPNSSISPSTGHIQAKAEVSNRPLTGHLSSKPKAINQSLTGNMSDWLTVNNDPSTQNMPASRKVSNQELIVDKPASLEGNNHPLAEKKPTRPEMNNYPSTLNKPARSEVNNAPSTANKSARPEVSSHPSPNSMPEGFEVNCQHSAANKPARPDVNNHPVTANGPARYGVNNHPSAANKPARPEVNYQPSNGSMLAGSEVNHQLSTDCLLATPDIKTQSSCKSVSMRPDAVSEFQPLRPEVSIKPRARFTTTRPLSAGPVLAEFPRVGETVECRTLVKGLKSYENLAAQKAPPSPCAKWKREQRSSCESVEGEHSNPPRTAERTRTQGPIIKIHKGKDLLKDTEPGEQKASIGTAREGGLGVRRAHSTKERSPVTAGAQDIKGQKPPSSPVEHLSSPQGARPSTLSRRTTLPRSVQSKGTTMAHSEGLKGASTKSKKETQTTGSGNVRELDKDRGFCYTLRPSLTSSRKTLPQTDSVQYRDTSMSPTTQKGLASPRPDSVTSPKLVTTPPVACRLQVSPKPEPTEAPRGHASSPVAHGSPTSSKAPFGSAKKPRSLAPTAAKVGKHCDPAPGAGTSQAERSRRTSSQPIWR
ncbi:excretory canal abnormal protein 6-like isoform X2 [Pleurodeles waltl]|uniref:excretory canal abnormal protein 6-like isoform X2 n=1 Tax=Pleurodeles waltl TaxID=8319 RepID=UPI003709911B